MTRLRIGRKPGVGPVLKLMRNNADDPFTTPNTEHEKFAFNSETGALSYILDVFKIERGGPTVYPSGGTYFPAPHHKVVTHTIGGQFIENHHINYTALFGLTSPPLVEERLGKPSSNRNEGQRARYGWDQLGGTLNFSGYVETWSTGAPIFYVEAGNLWGKVGEAIGTFYPAIADTYYICTVWDLPALDQPYSLPSATPVSGQKVLSIRPNRAKMTRPGFDVETAIGRQFIFDSDRIPAKVLRAGELTLPAGGTVDVMLPAGLQSPSALLYVDSMCRYTGSGENYYRHPTFRPTTFANWWQEGPTYDYQVLADRVRFISTNPREVLVRYIIVAEDATKTSGGTASVLRGSEALGYSQICRPGAQNPPRLGDIILDSRLPQIPIVAEGFIPWANFNTASDQPQMGTHRAPDITFSSPGYSLFPKFTLVFGDGTYTYPRAYRFYNSPAIAAWNGQLNKHSVLARVEPDYVRFYASPNNPNRVWWGAGFPSTPPAAPMANVHHDAGVILGVRYFIFGIPASL